MRGPSNTSTRDVGMKVRVKLYGVFRTAAGKSEFVLDLADKGSSVRSVITQLAAQKEFGTLKQLLLGSEASDPRPNALIMLSGREINTMDGLDTEITENDELALLPIAHGG